MYLDGLAMTKQVDSSISDINLLGNTAVEDSETTSNIDNMSEQKKCDENNNKNSKSNVKKIIESANEGVQVFNKSIEFTVHEETNKIMIKVVDNETDEVIKEIPAEKILDMVAKFCELAGILVDEKI